MRLQLLALSLALSTSVHAASVPIDQVPMYGGMDRAAVPALKAADEKLIADTTQHYGSRAKASAAFVDAGMNYYYHDDLAAAMRRFNQAWLLPTDLPLHHHAHSPSRRPSFRHAMNASSADQHLRAPGSEVE
jgi:hypothetical protein